MFERFRVLPHARIGDTNVVQSRRLAYSIRHLAADVERLLVILDRL
jgi:hypothetical protein